MKDLATQALPTVATGLLAMALWVSIRVRKSVASTTLTGPLAWMQAALTALILASFSTSLAFQYSAASLAICPFVSVMGAKRPQDRAWHFIVFSLWVVLILPAGEAAFIRPGSKLTIHPMRVGFLTTLLVMGFLNYAPTRFRWPACLFAIATALLLSPQYGCQDQPALFPLGAGACATAVLLATYRESQVVQRRSWNQTWLNFRDAFGALWALRVAGRANQAFATAKTPFTLEWNGFRVKPDGDSVLAGMDHSTEMELDPRSARCMRTLLRRFVCDDWYPPRPE